MKPNYKLTEKSLELLQPLIVSIDNDKHSIEEFAMSVMVALAGLADAVDVPAKRFQELATEAYECGKSQDNISDLSIN